MTYRFGKERFAGHTSTRVGRSPIAVVCGWCKATMRSGLLPVSHSICASCVERFYPEEA